MEGLYKILSEIRPEYDFKKSDNFIDDEFLDSFDIIALISEIEKQYNISIDAMDIIPENFETIDSIVILIEKSGGQVK